VETRYDSLGNDAIRIAKERILETVGITLAGAQEPDGAGKKVVELVREMGGNPKATVIGSNFKTSSPNAALANGASAMSLDLDDTVVTPTNHPSASYIPAVLALGEETGASGRKLLEAYVMGFEVGVRIGECLGSTFFTKMGFHQVAMWSPLGIAAAGAKLLDLSVDQMKSALGTAASSSCGIRRAFGTNTRPFHAAMAARNGITAALLAKKGFYGSKDILDPDPSGRPTSNMYFSFPVVFAGEGNYDLEALTRGLGGPLKLSTVAILTKWHPGCIPGNAFAERTLDLMQKYGFKADQVERVECSASGRALDIATYHEPQNGDEARWSIEYAVSAALLDGKVWIDQFREERIHRRDIRVMMKRVQLGEYAASGELAAQLPAMKMTVRLKDGREFKDEANKTKGDPSIPLRREALVKKYQDCASRVLPDARVEKTIELITNFEEMKDIGELMKLLRTRTRS
jgi:2-methylcitrate dehydratase PrpD